MRLGKGQREVMVEGNVRRHGKRQETRLFKLCGDTMMPSERGTKFFPRASEPPEPIFILLIHLRVQGFYHIFLYTRCLQFPK